MRKRHIAKTITWRIVGTLDTILLGYLITGNFETGLHIGGAELITKMILYYFHERIWYNLRIFKDGTSRFRHLLKTITWRSVGTIDTIILSWWISGNAEIGLAIGGLELFTKLALYYLHERFWYKIDYDKNKNTNTSETN